MFFNETKNEAVSPKSLVKSSPSLSPLMWLLVLPTVWTGPSWGMKIHVLRGSVGRPGLGFLPRLCCHAVSPGPGHLSWFTGRSQSTEGTSV